MSLVIEIRVNDEPPLAMVTAQRISLTDVAAADDVNDYVVKRYDVIDGRYELTADALVRHRYGNGAVALAYIALENVQ